MFRGQTFIPQMVAQQHSLLDLASVLFSQFELAVLREQVSLLDLLRGRYTLFPISFRITEAHFLLFYPIFRVLRKYVDIPINQMFFHGLPLVLFQNLIVLSQHLIEDRSCFPSSQYLAHLLEYRCSETHMQVNLYIFWRQAVVTAHKLFELFSGSSKYVLPSKRNTAQQNRSQC